MADRHSLEKHFDMSGGYVLKFSDRTFGELVFEAVGLDIHGEKYAATGTSKANKLRTFWKVESDHATGKLILALVDYDATLNTAQDDESKARAEKCCHWQLVQQRLLQFSYSRHTRRQNERLEIINFRRTRDLLLPCLLSGYAMKG